MCKAQEGGDDRVSEVPNPGKPGFGGEGSAPSARCRSASTTNKSVFAEGLYSFLCVERMPEPPACERRISLRASIDRKVACFRPEAISQPPNHEQDCLGDREIAVPSLPILRIGRRAAESSSG